MKYAPAPAATVITSRITFMVKNMTIPRRTVSAIKTTFRKPPHHGVFALNHREKKHSWNMPEIKFTSDAVKVLQSIVTRKQQKNSLAGSYQAMEAILDNVAALFM